LIQYDQEEIAIENKIPVVLMVFLILLTPMGALGYTFPYKPSPEHYYVDEAGLIDQKAGALIDDTAATLLAEDKIPLYVVTISSLADHDADIMSIEPYATALFNHWGIGWKDRNYGILLLISRDDSEARIELGADWGTGSAPQSRQVMDKIIIPAFKHGDYSNGIVNGVRGLAAMAHGVVLRKANTPGWIWLAWIGGSILFGLIIGFFPLIWNQYDTWIKGGGSGGSSSGFGGGSSDGGGDTGSW